MCVGVDTLAVVVVVLAPEGVAGDMVALFVCKDDRVINLSLLTLMVMYK